MVRGGFSTAKLLQARREGCGSLRLLWRKRGFGEARREAMLAFLGGTLCQSQYSQFSQFSAFHLTRFLKICSLCKMAVRLPTRLLVLRFTGVTYRTAMPVKTGGAETPPSPFHGSTSDNIYYCQYLPRNSLIPRSDNPVLELPRSTTSRLSLLPALSRLCRLAGLLSRIAIAIPKESPLCQKSPCLRPLLTSNSKSNEPKSALWSVTSKLAARKICRLGSELSVLNVRWMN